MIVGKTGSGKSVSWQMLQQVLSTMKKEGVPGYNLVKVGRIVRINSIFIFISAFFIPSI